MIYKKGFDGDSSFRNEGDFSSSSSSSKELFQEEAQEVSGTGTQLVVMAEPTRCVMPLAAPSLAWIAKFCELASSHAL